MVRQKEMENAIRFSLMMDDKMLKDLDKLSEKTKITRSRLIRIACNILFELVKEPGLDTDITKELVQEVDNQFDVMGIRKIIPSKKNRLESAEQLVHILYRSFVLKVLSDSIDDIADSGLMYYYIDDKGVFLQKVNGSGIAYKGFNADDIAILKEIIQEKKKKKFR